MPLKGISVTVNVVDWDTDANAGKAGDAANLSLMVVVDGVAAPATNTPTEVDGTNSPGLYSLVLTAAEMTGDVITVCGRSSTAQVSVIPVTFTTEGGKIVYLAKIAKNKLVEDPVAGTLVLYDDDGTTPLQSWTIAPAPGPFVSRTPV